MGVPSLAARRYFLSQMSSEASWNGMLDISCGSWGSSLTTVFILLPILPKNIAKRTAPEGRCVHPLSFELGHFSWIFFGPISVFVMPQAVLPQATFPRGPHTNRAFIDSLSKDSSKQKKTATILKRCNRSSVGPPDPSRGGLQRDHNILCQGRKRIPRAATSSRFFSVQNGS